VEPRAPSVAATAAAAALALAAGPHAALVTRGYPYASSCPAAGVRDAVDRWKMNTCNCTSYVAWALSRNGYRIDWFVPGAMDAWNWPNVARRRGIAVGARPRPGAVAVWPDWGKLGHVAIVTAAHADGTFDVAEYNPPGGRPRFAFDRRTRVDADDVTFLYVPRRP
jgi:surface antigen